MFRRHAKSSQKPAGKKISLERYLQGGVGLIVLLFLGTIFYQNRTRIREQKAQNILWPLIYHMEEGNYAKALHGTSVSRGLLNLIEAYGTTKTGQQARFYAARAYMAQKDFEQALALLQQIDLNENFFPKGNVLQLMGDCLVELKRWDEAKELYRSALKGDPKSPYAASYLSKLASLAIREKDIAQAIAYNEQICDHFPDSLWTIDARKEIAYLKTKAALGNA